MKKLTYATIDRTCPNCGANPAWPICEANDGKPCRTCLETEMGGGQALCRSCGQWFDHDPRPGRSKPLPFLRKLHARIRRR